MPSLNNSDVILTVFSERAGLAQWYSVKYYEVGSCAFCDTVTTIAV